MQRNFNPDKVFPEFRSAQPRSQGIGRIHGAVCQRNPSGKPRSRNAAFLPRLCDERNRGAGAAGRPRRPEAGPPARPVCDARGQHRLQSSVREMRARGRRRHGEISPPRRHGHLRHAGAHGPGFLAALPADRRAGQLRLGRRRQRRGDALHRVPAGEDRQRAHRRHRQGDRRFRPELRRQGAGAGGPAVAIAEPAGQRLVGHRRRHGDQHPAAQPDRDHQRLPRAARESRDRRSTS